MQSLSFTDRVERGKTGSQYSSVLGRSVKTVLMIGGQGVHKRVTPDDAENLKPLNVSRYRTVKAGLDDVKISHKIVPCSPGYWRFNGNGCHVDDWVNKPEKRQRRPLKKMLRAMRREAEHNALA